MARIIRFSPSFPGVVRSEGLYTKSQMRLAFCAGWITGGVLVWSSFQPELLASLQPDILVGWVQRALGG